MSTKSAAAQQLAEHLETSRLETQRLQAMADKIDAAEAAARSAAELAHYRDAAGPRASQYRGRRDELKTELDALALAPEINLGELFVKFIEMKSADAQCGSLNIHGATLTSVDPLGDNSYGVQRQHIVHCGELYQRLTWPDYLTWAVTQRTDAERSSHLQQLQSEAYEKEIRAGDEARAAAAAEQ